MVNRIVDVATVILISLAAVATAWCSYQGARWSAFEAFSYTKANEQRTESTQWASRANAHLVVDVLLFVEYQRALRNDPGFATFLFSHFDPPLRKAVNAWLATNPLHNANAPNSPFAMGAYRLVEDDRKEAAAKRADNLVERGASAQDLGDKYIFQTVLFAGASFLGGIAIKLRPPGHLVATALGFAIFLAGAIVTSQYPIR